MMNFRHVTAVAVAVSGLILGSSGTAATIAGCNTDNVEVAPNPADGDTGLSVVYDRALPDEDAVTNGRIAFTPPKAESPGIKVEEEVYNQSGGGAPALTFSGCLMTSNPGATCTSPFQSGKRIKQQMTGLGPVDLVFEVENDGTYSTYQVFHRLINDTNALLDGFKIELGYGIGDGFKKAAEQGSLSFSITLCRTAARQRLSLDAVSVRPVRGGGYQPQFHA